MEVSDSDGNILITGFLDPVKGLFLDDRATEQRMKHWEPSLFASTARHCNKTDYDGVVQPIFLIAEEHTAAANSYRIANIPALISYLNACARFPVIAT